MSCLKRKDYFDVLMQGKYPKIGTDGLKSLPDELIKLILGYLWTSKPCCRSGCKSICRTQIYVNKYNIIEGKGVRYTFIPGDDNHMRLCCKCAFSRRSYFLYSLAEVGGEKIITVKINKGPNKIQFGKPLEEKTFGTKIHAYQTKIINFILGTSNSEQWQLPK